MNIETKVAKLYLPVVSLVVIMLTLIFNADAQTLTTNPSGNYEVASSGAAVNVGTTVTIVDGATQLNAATVAISANYNTGDSLKINDATSGTDTGLSFSFNSGTGILTITGEAEEAIYQTVLRKVTFNTTSITTSSRTITFSLNAAIPYSQNGHYYEYISGTSKTWTEAKNEAAAKTYFGLRGYLVTVTSPGEKTFVSSKLDGATGWLGASDEGVEGQWRWVTGPEGTEDDNAGRLFWSGESDGSAVNDEFTDWNSGEPNNSNDEDYGQFVQTTGKWNDLPDNGSVNGYVVEYGGTLNDPVVHISDNVAVDVVINPTGITGTTTICQGASTALTVQGGQGTVHWYTGSCGGTEIETTGSTITVTPLETTTYYARNEVDDTFSNDCASITITVNPLLQYQSAHSGNWTDAANWEQFNGTEWVAATSYPGEVSNSCGLPLITVQANHTMTLYSGSVTVPNLTIKAGGVVKKDINATLVITGQLVMEEDANGGIQIESIDQ